jgi:hypothetical protein
VRGDQCKQPRLARPAQVTDHPAAGEPGVRADGQFGDEQYPPVDRDRVDDLPAEHPGGE